MAMGYQGTLIPDCWMWTGKTTDYTDGTKQIQTTKVITLKEIAYHYWIDEWLPTKAFSDVMLREMEIALREHETLQQQGIQVPDGEFLEPLAVPKDLLEMQDLDFTGKTREGEIDPGELDALRKLKQAESTPIGGEQNG